MQSKPRLAGLATTASSLPGVQEKAVRTFNLSTFKSLTHSRLVDERLITERRFPGVSKDILKYLPWTGGELLTSVRALL